MRLWQPQDWPSEGAGRGWRHRGEVWGKRGSKLCVCVCVAEVMCAVCGCGCGCGWGSFVCYFCCCCRVRPAAWLPRGRGQWGGQFSAKFCNLLRLLLVVLVVVAQKLMKANLFQRVHQNVCSSWMLERDSNICIYVYIAKSARKYCLWWMRVGAEFRPPDSENSKNNNNNQFGAYAHTSFFVYHKYYLYSRDRTRYP